MKKLLSAFLIVTLALLTACSSGVSDDEGTKEESATTEEGSGSVTIGLSISTLDNPFFVTLHDAILEKAEAEGMEVIVSNAQDDPSKEISGIEDLIQQDVDILLINPTDSAAVSSAVESANSAGIPVITIDRSADSGEVETLITSDNVAGGEMAAQYILDQLGENAKVVELEGIPGASAARERGEGFHKVADEKLDVVVSQTANFDRGEGMTVMEDIIQGNPEIQAVFAHNDEMALGAVEAIKAAGLDDILIVGFDGTEDALAAIESGDLDATIAQQPVVMAEKAIEAVGKVLNGEELEEITKVPLELTTKE